MMEQAEALQKELDQIDVSVNERNLGELLYTAGECGMYEGIEGLSVEDAKRVYKMVLLAQSYGSKGIPDELRM